VPWGGPPEELPTLGAEVGEWIEGHCVIPDGEQVGRPYRLTDEMWEFLLHHYRVRPDADESRPRSAFHYRRSQLVRPQKWGKSPFSAALICAEAVGPTVFAGWDADGYPVGKPWATPLIQVTASSEDQTANVYAALRPMIEDGPLSAVIPDTGETRINLPGGGRIEPVTAQARSRLGQRVTFAVQDETGTWTRQNGGRALADTQRRGLAGMGGRAVETTNAWDPMEASVAQATFESRAADVYRDYRRAPTHLSYRTAAERRRIHRHVYGDSWWVDLDRIEAEAAELLERDPAQAERFFGNRLVQGLGSYLTEAAWDAGLRARAVEPGTPLCLGFDGSRSGDWSALRAETLDGHRFTPTYGPDDRPAYWNPEEWGGQIPRGEVQAAVAHMFDRYEVRLMFIDPRHWETQADEWALAHGEDRVQLWPTNQLRRMHTALARYRDDLVAGDSTHDDDTVARLHALAARTLAKPGDRFILGKPSENQKIDILMADVLAHEAAASARAAGWSATPRKSRNVVIFR
jgi:hypothetical protein